MTIDATANSHLKCPEDAASKTTSRVVTCLAISSYVTNARTIKGIRQATRRLLKEDYRNQRSCKKQTNRRYREASKHMRKARSRKKHGRDYCDLAALLVAQDETP
jgi:hypothetical protein